VSYGKFFDTSNSINWTTIAEQFTCVFYHGRDWLLNPQTNIAHTVVGGIPDSHAIYPVRKCQILANGQEFLRSALELVLANSFCLAVFRPISFPTQNMSAVFSVP
jgi:hypothetical protein